VTIIVIPAALCVQGWLWCGVDVETVQDDAAGPRLRVSGHSAGMRRRDTGQRHVLFRSTRLRAIQRHWTVPHTGRSQRRRLHASN